jgi:Ca2+-binding EF-hand superfamily protein
MNRILSFAITCGLCLGLNTVAGAADEKKKKPEGMDLKALFAKIDTNNDKKISKEEFEAFKGPLTAKATKAGKEGKEPKGLAAMKDKIFAKLDTNNDGFVTMEEFSKLKEALAAAKEKAKKKAN